MIKEINTSLLEDLVRLTKKYEAEDWETLLLYLNDETKRAGLVKLLESLSTVSRRHASLGKRGKKSPGIYKLLQDLKAEDPAKADILKDFWQKLITRELLPSAGSLRHFAEVSGLKRPTSEKREQAISELICQLLNLPLEVIKEILGKASISHNRDFGEEYTRWVQLILGRKL